jgi:hypothetical protein
MTDQPLNYYRLKITPAFLSKTESGVKSSDAKTALVREQARRYEAFKVYADEALRVFKVTRLWAWEWFHSNKEKHALSAETLRLAAYQVYASALPHSLPKEALDTYYFIINIALEEGIVAAKTGEQRPPVSAKAKARIPITTYGLKVEIQNLCVRIPGAPEVYLKKPLPQDFHISDIWLEKPVKEWVLLVSSKHDFDYIPGHSGKQPLPNAQKAEQEQAPLPTPRQIEGTLPASRGVDNYMENARKAYALARAFSRDYMAGLPKKGERRHRSDQPRTINQNFELSYKARLAQTPDLARTTYLHGLEEGVVDFEKGRPFNEHAPFDGFFRIMFGRPVVVKKSGASFILPALGEVKTQAMFFEGAKILKVFARKGDNGWVLLIEYVDTHPDAFLDIM